MSDQTVTMGQRAHYLIVDPLIETLDEDVAVARRARSH